jgi:ubiquinone/menaquinone biosynthesis C-methylase UbiE
VTSASRLQRAIGALYGWAADKLYEPVVVHGAFRVFGGRLNELVLEQGERAVAAAAGAPILDVPVGTAYFTLRTPAFHDGLLVGADYAWGMVAQATRSAMQAGRELVCVQADIHRLPFADGSFAAVLCTNGLQVIPDLQSGVRELTRVLSHRGVLLISVLLAPLGALLPIRAARDHLPAILRTGNSIADAMTAAGLAVVSVRRERFAYLLEATKL